jgi:hypothetical protein
MNKLPELPKIMQRKEADFGLTFRTWFFENIHHFGSVGKATFELKQTQSDSIPFSCLEDRQIGFADAVRFGKNGALVRVESGTPGASDYIFLKEAPANIVIFFAKKGFVIIAVDLFIMEKNRSKRKSLVWERALSLSHISHLSPDGRK